MPLAAGQSLRHFALIRLRHADATFARCCRFAMMSPMALYRFHDAYCCRRRATRKYTRAAMIRCCLRFIDDVVTPL